jgi:hypothetical protein
MDRSEILKEAADLAASGDHAAVIADLIAHIDTLQRRIDYMSEMVSRGYVRTDPRKYSKPT